MTAWMLLPTRAGRIILTRIFAGMDVEHLVSVGEADLSREQFADLAARFGEPEPFDRQTGEPKRVTVVDSPATVLEHYQRGWRDGARWRNDVHAEEQARGNPLPSPVLQPTPWGTGERNWFEPAPEAGERTEDEPGAVA